MIALEKLQGVNLMGLSAPLTDSYTNNYSETRNCHQNLEMVFLKNLQGINPMGISAPLANSYPNNCSETSNCHQNIEIVDLKPVNKFMIIIVTTKRNPHHNIM